MSFFDQLTPQQKQYGMVGAVVVAVFALISRFRSGQAAAPASTSEQSSTTDTTTTGTPTGSFAVGSTDAIGVGQLSEFESILTSAVGGLSTQVDQLAQTIQNPPPPPAATPPPPPATETTPAPPKINTTMGAVVAAAAACAGRTREIPGFAPAPPGKYAEPIVVQGTTIGVSYHPC